MGTSPAPFQRVAHRGACREFPENTLPAFERALERGADAIELDVHATADGIVVVHHDASLGRTEGAHHGQPIAGLEWSALQVVEVTAGITVPSLAQVLDLVGDRAFVYVEIKGRDIEALVVETIRNGGARCAVHSFDHAAIERCRALAPDIPRGILFDHPPDALADSIARTGATAVWPNWRLADAELVRTAHVAGARVVAWTVNTRATAQHLAALGVDAICSDDLRLFGD